MPDAPFSNLPQAHFGKIDEKPMDWRKVDDPDSDDEVLKKTPKDVVDILGFDPLEFED